MLLKIEILKWESRKTLLNLYKLWHSKNCNILVYYCGLCGLSVWNMHVDNLENSQGKKGCYVVFISLKQEIQVNWKPQQKTDKTFFKTMALLKNLETTTQFVGTGWQIHNLWYKLDSMEWHLQETFFAVTLTEKTWNWTWSNCSTASARS